MRDAGAGRESGEVSGFHPIDSAVYPRIDRALERIRKGEDPGDPTPAPQKPTRQWLSLDNEALWTGPDDVMTWVITRPSP